MVGTIVSHCKIPVPGEPISEVNMRSVGLKVGTVRQIMTRSIRGEGVMRKVAIVTNFILITLISSLVSVRPVEAQTVEESPRIGEVMWPGRAEGTGTHFEIADSEYLNLTLDSSESISVVLESIPQMIEMDLASDDTAAATSIQTGTRH